jgi:ribonuclease P protein component
MLKRLYRLRSDRDIQRVFSKGKGVFDSVCGIKFVANNLPYSRAGVTVGVKVNKRAVVRNKVKRHYREIVRNHFNLIAPGYDIMLLTSKGATDLSYAEKEKRLIRVLEKAGLYARL